MGTFLMVELRVNKHHKFINGQTAEQIHDMELKSHSENSKLHIHQVEDYYYG